MQLSGKLSRQYFQNEPITSEIAKRHGLIDRIIGQKEILFLMTKRFHKVTSRFKY